MDERDRNAICTNVAVAVIKSLKLNPETAHLRLETPQHVEEWVKGIQQVIDKLQLDLIEVVRNRSA